MLTKDEALEAMWSHFRDRGLVEKRQPSGVRLVTRKSLEEDPYAIDLKVRRPEAWAIVQSTFRDHWCVMFKRGGGSPPYDIIHIDAETGEVTFPRLL